MFSKAFMVCGATALILTAVSANAARPTTANARYAQSAYVPFSLGSCFSMNPGCAGVYDIDWLSDGRMVLLTSDVVYQGNMPAAGRTGSKVTLLHGFGTEDSLYVQDIATGFKLPTGLVVVNDTIYVADMDTFYRVPTNAPALDSASLFGNREARFQQAHPTMYDGHLEPFNFQFPAPQSGPDNGQGTPDGGWTTMNSYWHQYMYSPYYHQGKIYAAQSGATRNQGGWADLNPVSFFGGSILSFEPSINSLDTALHRTSSGGLRSPGGLGNGKDFALVSDNQGGYRPMEELFAVRQGEPGYYGYKQGGDPGSSDGYSPNWAQAAHERGQLPYQPSVVAMRFSEEGWRSPGQPMYIPAGPYAGDWLVGAVNSRGISRVAFDSLPDTTGAMNVQGAVFWFTGHNEDPSIGTGDHAMFSLAYGPDGAIYAGTLRNRGNWASGTPSQLIYRYAPNDSADQFEVLKIRSLADGYELILSEPVNPSEVGVANFTVRQRNWVRQFFYGQGAGSFSDRPVSSVDVSGDRMRIHLEVPGIRRINQDRRGDTVTHWQTHFAFNDLASAAGAPNFTDEATYTQNWISPRTWDPGEPTRIARAVTVSPLQDRVWFTRSPGLLRVHVDVMEPYQVSLGDVRGRVLGRRTGSGGGSVEFTRPRGNPGVHVVEVRSGADVYRKTVSF